MLHAIYESVQFRNRTVQSQNTHIAQPFRNRSVQYLVGHFALKSLVTILKSCFMNEYTAVNNYYEDVTKVF